MLKVRLIFQAVIVLSSGMIVTTVVHLRMILTAAKYGHAANMNMYQIRLCTKYGYVPNMVMAWKIGNIAKHNYY